MEISHLTGSCPPEWDDLLAASDDAWLFHTRAWIELAARVRGFENHFFMARENGRAVGGLVMQLIRLTKHRQTYSQAKSLSWGAAGPFCVRGLETGARQRGLAELSEAVFTWAKEQSVQKMTCVMPALTPTTLNNPRGVNPLVLAGWHDTATHTRIADLSRQEEELWSDLAYDARRSIKQARTAGYTVTRGEWPALLDEHYRLHAETYQRTGVDPFPKEYFEEIAKHLAPAGQAVLWVGHDPQGQPVAFHNQARYRDGAQYWTGCCANDHLRSGISYLLFWEALLGAKADGLRWYEIGEVFPNVREGKLHGLTVFKEKFGGEIYRSYAGEIILAAPPAAPLLERALHYARRKVTKAN